VDHGRLLVRRSDRLSFAAYGVRRQAGLAVDPLTPGAGVTRAASGTRFRGQAEIGSISLGSLFITLPARVLTGQKYHLFRRIGGKQALKVTRVRWLLPKPGSEVSQQAASTLRSAGIDARYLEHGISGWAEHRLPLRSKRDNEARSWVTRERPKIDRIACPWLIRRFIDPEAEFLFVPTDRVFSVTSETGATAYDIPEAIRADGVLRDP
jgi:ChrB, C-terminal domain